MRILLRAVTILCVMCAAWAYAGTAPLPPFRPADLATPAPSATVPSPEDNDALRTQVLASRRILGDALPAIVETGGCGIVAPLRLDAILLADGTKVTLSPAVTMRATLASAIADWVREDLAPAIPKGDALTGIDGAGGYECRGRNRIAGAKLSEHAKGNALDLEAIHTAQGKRFAVAAPSAESASFLALMKKTACLRFSTVLGPGSDAFHAQHLHVDLEARRDGTRLCEWTLPEEAAPKP